MTLQEYYNECIHMLNRQPCDWRVGAAERSIIATCHRDNRPITSAVAYIMRSPSAPQKAAPRYIVETLPTKTGLEKSIMDAWHSI